MSDKRLLSLPLKRGLARLQREMEEFAADFLQPLLIPSCGKNQQPEQVSSFSGCQ